MALLRTAGVHVYVLEEHGRMLMRRLVYAPDATTTLHVPQPVCQSRLPRGRHLLECGDPEAMPNSTESIVVKRRRDSTTLA